MRTFVYTFTVECHSQGSANLRAVEEMIDLTMQGLLESEEFIKALDEKEAVTIQVQQIG